SVHRPRRARNPYAVDPVRLPHLFGAARLTHDVQRTTRFTYWQCRHDHGQLITFHHFLREKNFIRAPSPAELAKLRATVCQIACSQCGAPIDLANASACTHCGAPIALIDPDSVAKALHDLAAGASSPTPSDPDAMRNRLSEAQIDAIFDLAQTRRDDKNHDIVAVGAAAIGALISGLLVAR